MTVFKFNNGVPFGRSCIVMEVYFLQNLSEKVAYAMNARNVLHYNS